MTEEDDDKEYIHIPIGDPIEGKTIPIEVVPDEKMSEIDLMMCVRKADDQGYFDDNKEGLCAWGCGETIIWRPYMPDHLTKVCVQCAVTRMQQEDC